MRVARLPSASYSPRRPEQTALYRILSEHLETFLHAASDQTRWPGFVEQELRSFLTCGLPCHGFVRVRCPQCAVEQAVAFRCKRRAFCPGCGGRRMAATAARLVDDLLPHLPYRQWVLTLPFRLRYRAAFSVQTLQTVVGAFVQTIVHHYQAVAALDGIAHTQGAAITWIQRFGSDLRLNPHLHVIAAEGVFRKHSDGDHLRFYHTLSPSTDDVKRALLRTHRAIATQLTNTGVLDDDIGWDPLVEDEPLLAHSYATAVSGHQARRSPAIHRLHESHRRAPARRCVQLDGFSVHANTLVLPHDRQRLEQLIRYAARPALSYDRVELTSKNLVRLRLKRAYDDGTTHQLFEPLDFISRLAALVPPPRRHLIRYHGILAPNAHWRPDLLGMAAMHRHQAAPHSDHPTSNKALPTNRYLDWATLLKRTFAIDALECRFCGHPMHILAIIDDKQKAARILRAMGLPHTPPLHTPARAPPQLDFDLIDEDPLADNKSFEDSTVQQMPRYEDIDQSLEA